MVCTLLNEDDLDLCTSLKLYIY